MSDFNDVLSGILSDKNSSPKKGSQKSSNDALLSDIKREIDQLKNIASQSGGGKRKRGHSRKDSQKNSAPVLKSRAKSKSKSRSRKRSKSQAGGKRKSKAHSKKAHSKKASRKRSKSQHGGKKRSKSRSHSKKAKHTQEHHKAPKRSKSRSRSRSQKRALPEALRVRQEFAAHIRKTLGMTAGVGALQKLISHYTEKAMKQDSSLDKISVYPAAQKLYDNDRKSNESGLKRMIEQFEKEAAGRRASKKKEKDAIKIANKLAKKGSKMSPDSEFSDSE